MIRCYKIILKKTRIQRNYSFRKQSHPYIPKKWNKEFEVGVSKTKNKTWVKLSNIKVFKTTKVTRWRGFIEFICQTLLPCANGVLQYLF
jgi:hypothetical protein